MGSAVQRFKENEERIDVFVNESDTTDVTTRTGETYPTLRKAVRQLFENGGLPAAPFTTKALMIASSLVDGDYVQVTDDAVVSNNGLYVKTGGSWVKSEYDPVNQAKDYLESYMVEEGSIKPTLVGE